MMKLMFFVFVITLTHFTTIGQSYSLRNNKVALGMDLNFKFKDGHAMSMGNIRLYDNEFTAKFSMIGFPIRRNDDWAFRINMGYFKQDKKQLTSTVYGDNSAVYYSKGEGTILEIGIIRYINLMNDSGKLSVFPIIYYKAQVGKIKSSLPLYSSPSTYYDAEEIYKINSFNLGLGFRLRLWDKFWITTDIDFLGYQTSIAEFRDPQNPVYKSDEKSWTFQIKPRLNVGLYFYMNNVD